MNKKKHIAILTPCYTGDFDKETKKCIEIASQKTDFKIHTFTTQEVYIHRGRTILLKDLLDFNKKQKIDYVLWLDSDITFEPNHLTTLVKKLEQNKLQCLSGIYFNRHLNHHPMFCHGSVKYGFCWNNPFIYDLIQVKGVGLGFFLFKQKVLLKYASGYPPIEWFDSSKWCPTSEHYDKQINTVGEDLDFCFKLAKIGIPIHVTNKVIVKHKGIGIEDYQTWANEGKWHKHWNVKRRSL